MGEIVKKETERSAKSLLPIDQVIDEESVKIVKYIEEHYPAEIKEKMGNVVKLLEEGKHVPQLYPEVVAEVPMSQSSFLDICVQMEEHFTPHRKLRQCMLELQGKLEALHTAKHGHRKAIIKIERIKLEKERIEQELEKAREEGDELKIKELELDLAEIKVELDEALDSLRSAQHMVKDALLKVIQYQELAERYKKEVEESGLSFEEAELIYYVMYFTKDAEKQIRTAGRIDTGTYGAIAQLPEGLRRKVLQNIEFIMQKIAEGWPVTGDYLYLTYWDQMLPQKTGEGEIEGVKVSDFIAYTPPKIIAKEEVDDVIKETEEELKKGEEKEKDVQS